VLHLCLIEPTAVPLLVANAGRAGNARSDDVERTAMYVCSEMTLHAMTRDRVAASCRCARFGAILALVAANVIWGTTFVATKPLLAHIPPLTIAAARFAVALLVLLPLVLRAGKRPTFGKTPALMGFTGVFLVYLCQNMGLKYTSAANGALIHGGIPIFTALLAALALGERQDRTRLTGIAASLVGVAAVILLGTGGGLGLAAAGDGLVLVSAVALAAYLVIGRRAFAEADALALVTGVTCYGLLFLVPASAVELSVVGMKTPTVGDLAGLVFLGACASALAFVLWAHGLRHLEAAQAASFANLCPLVGLGVAALLLGERVSPAQLAGGVAIVAGVWLASRDRTTRDAASRRTVITPVVA
jgi:drug/metabolite transporter (DMT)-like permease